ncbi:MAG: mandelate racemase/muconate lactonizing enzyme family protein, partial [bacterium]|nr:mandelate racemase/muconate lactonizing enzyme family protein [bacterium]
MTRRDLFRLALAVPATSWLSRYNALAAPHSGKVKITAVKAMQLSFGANNTLIKIETDAGLVGYGEAGSSGDMARARIETMNRFLIGRDPLAIERHFHEMSTIMHTYMAHIPTVSGVDLALWDLAGKILDRPVYQLMGGPFRSEIPMYSHGPKDSLLDKSACRDWAARVKAAPEGFTAFKFGVDSAAGVSSARYANNLTTEQIRRVGRGYMNVREAAGSEIDIAVHCHNEFDTPSAIAVAKAVEPMDPLFYEDALNPPYSEGWMALKRSTRIPILTGEKLEMVAGFRPFLDNQAADIIHPDLAFAGGLTGVKKIADYAALSRTPVALHNVGTLVLTYASAHFAAAIQ